MVACSAASLESAIDAGARDTPHTRNTRQTITASNGGRECAAHRLNLLCAKGRLPSIAAILLEQLVVHGDLAHLRFQPGDLIVAVITFALFQSCCCSRKRAVAPFGQLGDGDIRLPGPTSSNGSPRNNRATTANLRLTKNPSAHSLQRPKGRLHQLWGSAPAPPSRLAPVIIRHV